VINGGRAYLSLTKTSGTRAFFEVVLKSEISSLLFDGSLYFLYKGGLLMELGNSKEEVTKDGKTFLLSKNEYKTVLLNQLRDCPSIPPLIDRTGYHRKPMYRLLKSYYQCVNVGFSDPVNKAWSKLDFIISAGGVLSKFSFVDTEFKQFGKGGFSSAFSPLGSIGLDFYSPKLNENVKIFTRLSFQANKITGHFVNSNSISRMEYDLTLKTTTIKIPIGLKVNVLRGANPVYLSGGVNFEPILNGECAVIRREILQSTGSVITTNSQAGPFKKVMKGLVFSLGKEFSASPKVQYFTELRFEKMSGYMSTANPSGSALTALVCTLGIKMH
jgi:hypothetical protein